MDNFGVQNQIHQRLLLVLHQRSQLGARLAAAEAVGAEADHRPRQVARQRVEAIRPRCPVRLEPHVELAQRLEDQGGDAPGADKLRERERAAVLRDNIGHTQLLGKQHSQISGRKSNMGMDNIRSEVEIDLVRQSLDVALQKTACPGEVGDTQFGESSLQYPGVPPGENASLQCAQGVQGIANP